MNRDFIGALLQLNAEKGVPREQLVRTDTDAVRRARQALDDLEATWRGRMARMDDVLADPPHPEPTSTRRRKGPR